MNKMRELFRWYFSKKALPVWCMFLFDCATVFLSCLLVYTINNGILMTWQQFYEFYDLYGEDKNIWNNYIENNRNGISWYLSFKEPPENCINDTCDI